MESALHFIYIHARLNQPVKCLKIEARLMAQIYIKSCALHEWLLTKPVSPGSWQPRANMVVPRSKTIYCH